MPKNSLEKMDEIRDKISSLVDEFAAIKFDEVNVQWGTELIETLLKAEDKIERLASERQISYVTTLAERRVGGEAILEALKIATPTSKEVSVWIDTLQQAPFAKTITITETGAYRYDGVVYSVRKGRQSRNWQVFSLTDGAWTYNYKAFKILYELKYTDRLTLNEAIEASGQTGSCVHCGITLTALKSVTGGMGSTCAKKYSN
jgi:hypothetical protein